MPRTQQIPDEIKQRSILKIRAKHIAIALVSTGFLFSSIRTYTSFSKYIASFTYQTGQIYRDLPESITDGSNVLNLSSTDPDPTLRTIALTEAYLRGGFRNQAMRFTAFVMQARDMNISQILLPSIRWGDRDASRAVPHEELFDVEHWNTYYPRLPRLVTYDPKQHYQWDATDRLLNATFPGNRAWFPNAPDQFLETNTRNRTKPYRGGGGARAGVLWSRYRRYSLSIVKSGGMRRRDRIETIIYSALAPSRKLREKLKQINLGSKVLNALESKAYIALHARVETEMVYHSNKCKELQEFNLTKILSYVEETFDNKTALTGHEAPFQAVFLPMDKQNLIQGANFGKDAISVDNLATLTQIEKKGMWNGHSPIFNVGSESLADDVEFEGMTSIAGMVINFFIAVDSDTFVGTPISTWSTDVWTVRYFRGKFSNYIYVPGKLEKITFNGTEPQPYSCMH